MQKARWLLVADFGAAMIPCAQQVGLQRAASARGCGHLHTARNPADGEKKATTCLGFIKRIRQKPGNATPKTFWGAKPNPVVRGAEYFITLKRNSSFTTLGFEQINPKEAEKLKAGWG